MQDRADLSELDTQRSQNRSAQMRRPPKFMTQRDQTGHSILEDLQASPTSPKRKG